MRRVRTIPCLLLKNDGLVKTIKFKDPVYLGDPINTVRILNEKEADELVLLDITATKEKRGPLFEQLQEITSECFMPLGYGGGVRTIDDVKKLFYIGIEKVIINTYAFENPPFIKKVVQEFGSQSIVCSIDVKKHFFGKYEVFINGGKRNTGVDPVSHARNMEAAGVGEIIINSINQDGMMQGYDIDLIKKITSAVNIPVIALGGAGKIEDLSEAVESGGASGVAAGSLFVFQGKHRAVLINYPSREELSEAFKEQE